MWCWRIEPAVQGVVGIGSIANGLARPDSDIDAIVFFDPLDLYIAPAEAIWRPSDDSFHSIFSDVEGIQLDLARLDLACWSDPDFEWPEGRRAEMADGWLAYDRDGRVAELIAERTAYGETSDWPSWMKPSSGWTNIWAGMVRSETGTVSIRSSLMIACRRPTAIWCRRCSPPIDDGDPGATGRCPLCWRCRGCPRISPNACRRSRQCAFLRRRSHGGMWRVQALRGLFEDLCQRLTEESDYGGGEYGDDIVGEAFIRSYEEPGRCWNMDEWNARRQGD